MSVSARGCGAGREIEGQLGDVRHADVGARQVIDGCPQGHWLTGRLQSRLDRQDHRVRITDCLKIQDGKWTLQLSRFKQSKGLAFSGDIDVHVMSMLEQCDGTRPLKDVLQVLCERIDGDARAVEEATIAVVKRLLRAGLLVPCP